VHRFDELLVFSRQVYGDCAVAKHAVQPHAEVHLHNVLLRKYFVVV
jgi:hypothetical protein